MPTDISNRIKHSTTVDFVKRTTQRPVHIVQYDNSLPILEVSLKNNGVDYDIPNDISDVRIRFGKPDRTFVINSMLDVSGDNNHTVYFELTRQMTVFPGTFHPVVELIKVVNDEDIVAASGYIEIEIDRNPVQDEYVESTVEYKSLVKYAEDAEEAAESAAESAESASESAENAEESSEDAEAWAVGERNGTPVSSSDPTYHNNSKWYSERTSNKADKDLDSVTGNLAEFDSSHNPVDSGVPADKVMLSDGSYSEANVGTSDNLVDKKAVGVLQDPFYIRPTAGEEVSINEEGLVQVQSIHGNTLVWNQLASNSEASLWNVQNVTLSLSGGEFVLTSTTGDFYQKIVYIPLEKGHKYFGRLDIAAGTANCRGGFFDSNNTPIEASEYVSGSPVASVITKGKKACVPVLL